MAKNKTREPKIIRPDDIDPHHRLGPAAAVAGHMQVDFEERVNFRRLHDYRLARTRAALANSGLGALLCFDQHNIRYTTSTVIGEWARDKLTRYSLLTGNGDPYSGTSARRRSTTGCYTPWLCKDHCHAGLLGLRGAVGGDGKLFRAAAREIKALLDAEGVGDMPLGVDVVELPMMLELQKLGHRRARRAADDAAGARGEEHRRADAAQHGGGDGRRRLPGHRRGAEARRQGERDRRAGHACGCTSMGSDCVEAINAISGERCSPHPHNFTDRLIRPGDQAFFDIIQSYMGYRTCYYRTFNVGRATQPQRDAYKQGARMDGPRDRSAQARRVLRHGRRVVPDGAGDRLRERDGRLRPELLPRPGARACTSGR